MRYAIVEDDPAEAQLIKTYMTSFLGSEQAGGLVETFTDGRAFLSAHTPGRYGLVLLDCMLGAAPSGIDVARAMRAGGDCTPVVLVTSSPDFALAGYEVGATGYLLKPVSFERLSSTLLRIGILPVLPEPVCLRDASRTVTIDARSIVSIRVRGHYVIVSLATGKTMRLRTSFAEVSAALASHAQFACCARGFLVNYDYVSGIDELDFVLCNGERVPMSVRIAPQIKRTYADYLFNRVRRSGS